MLTGHGCFNDNLYRFRNSVIRLCSQCGTTPDTAEHAVAVFKCDAFYHSRRMACTYLGVDRLTAENVLEVMLRSKEDWLRVSTLVTKIMTTREAEEWLRQQVAARVQQP